VEPLIPERQRDSDKPYKRKSGGGRKHAKIRKKYLKVFSMCCEQDANGKPPLKANTAVAGIFLNGKQWGCLNNSDAPVCWNVMSWKGLPGNGKVLMVR
jgi:hypothetical protein